MLKWVKQQVINLYGCIARFFLLNPSIQYLLSAEPMTRLAICIYNCDYLVMFER